MCSLNGFHVMTLIQHWLQRPRIHSYIEQFHLLSTRLRCSFSDKWFFPVTFVRRWLKSLIMTSKLNQSFLMWISNVADHIYVSLVLRPETCSCAWLNHEPQRGWLTRPGRGGQRCPLVLRLRGSFSPTALRGPKPTDSPQVWRGHSYYCEFDRDRLKQVSASWRFH